MRANLVRDRGHRPELDGLRAVAILLVLGQHAPTRPLIDGFVGVTVFFCLSGFLITSLLVRELDGGTIDLRAFYRRRVARLCPGLVTVVVATVAVLVLDRQDLGVGQVLAPAGAALTYTTSLFDWSNHVFATKDYFNYTWSLSVEEQFYLLWPCALLWGYRRDPRLFAVLTAILVGTTLALDVYLGLSRHVQYDQHEYFGTDTNALPILVGSLLAIVVHQGWLSQTVRRLAPWALPAVALLPVLAYRNDTYRPSLVIVAGTALTLVALAGLVTLPRSTAGSLLATGPMRWLGERSYSIYLWNVLARIAVLGLLGHTYAGDLIWIAMFALLAEASYRFVERPMRARLAARARVPGEVILAPVAVGADLPPPTRPLARQRRRSGHSLDPGRCASSLDVGDLGPPAGVVPAGDLGRVVLPEQGVVGAVRSFAHAAERVQEDHELAVGDLVGVVEPGPLVAGRVPAVRTAVGEPDPQAHVPSG